MDGFLRHRCGPVDDNEALETVSLEGACIGVGVIAVKVLDSLRCCIEQRKRYEYIIFMNKPFGELFR